MRPGTNLLVGVNAQLDTSTGIATWKFTSIDPSTGLPTTNPAAGFLPPGANGSVFFTVMPKQNVTSGTKVQNQATIVFDGNPPMSTPTWLNTFDVTLPTSKVQPLPATEAASSFPVSWTGTDADSGVQDYTIYVSVDGGAFSAWLTKTTATSATFTGQAGHTYAFYSIAEDNVGNIEAAKTAAEASTQVVTAPQCTNSINYANGFTGNGLTLNGGATISGSALQLTDGGTYEARSAFYPAAVPIDNFVTDFTFQLTNAQADGFTFVVQTNSPQALGGGGPGLGYVGIPSSAALKFDLYNNAGEGTSSTGFYLDGTYPTKPSFDLLSKGIDLHSGHIFAAHLVYNGTLVTATITDTVTQTSVTLTDRIPPKAPGGLAYLGFTGATGKLSATQNILTWTYSSTLPCPVQ